MSLRNTSSRRIAARLARFAGLSVGAHAVLFAVLAASGQLRGCGKPVEFALPSSGEPIDVTMIEPTPLNPFAAPRTEEEEQARLAAEVERLRQAEEDPDAKQVVEIPRPAQEIRPDDTDLAAEYDSKVAKQTKAPDLGLPGANHIVVPGKGKADREVPPAPKPKSPAESKKGPGALAMRGSSEGGGGDDRPKASGDPFGFDAKRVDGGELPAKGVEGKGDDRGDEGKGADGDMGKGGGGDTPDLEDLRPTEETLAKVISEGSSDYLPDIDEGAETLLDTKRFKYASFMNRVKRAVEQTWDPNSEYRLRDPYGQKYGVKNRHTVLKVSLKPDGRIRDLILEKSCGVDFLDDEAISAMREAEPFPNPPKGMIDADSNLITFRFHFFFAVGEQPSFKIFRYSN